MWPDMGNHLQMGCRPTTVAFPCWCPIRRLGCEENWESWAHSLKMAWFKTTAARSISCLKAFEIQRKPSLKTAPTVKQKWYWKRWSLARGSSTQNVYEQKGFRKSGPNSFRTATGFLRLSLTSLRDQYRNFMVDWCGQKSAAVSTF